MRATRRARLSPVSRLGGVAGALLAIGVVWLLASVFAPPADPIDGRAVAVDGDTLRIGDNRIRLTGLDAPELDQTCAATDGSRWDCGSEARGFLKTLLDGGETRCFPSGRDRYHRVLARCGVVGDDIGRTIVAAGWAVSTDLGYLTAEQSARSAHLGVWAGTFETPADWRRDHGQAESGLWDWIRSWFG